MKRVNVIPANIGAGLKPFPGVENGMPLGWPRGGLFRHSSGATLSDDWIRQAMPGVAKRVAEGVAAKPSDLDAGGLQIRSFPATPLATLSLLQSCLSVPSCHIGSVDRNGLPGNGKSAEIEGLASASSWCSTGVHP